MRKDAYSRSHLVFAGVGCWMLTLIVPLKAELLMTSPEAMTHVVPVGVSMLLLTTLPGDCVAEFPARG